MAHVFISYAHKDYDDFVKQFIERLEKAGFDKWIDHEQLAGGKDWTEDIDKGINQAYGLILIISNSSAQSDYVKYEWAFALGQGVPMIPIIYQAQNSLPPRLIPIQYFDFTDPNWSQWDAFIARLKEVRDEFGTIVRIPSDAPRDVRDGLNELNSTIPQRRENAAQHLGNMGNPLAVPGLIMRLKDQNTAVWIAATEALGKIGDERGVEPLMDVLARYYETSHPFGLEQINDPPDHKISRALIQIGSNAIPALTKGLKCPTPNMRIAIALILGRIKDKEAIAALIEAIGDNNNEAQRMIIWALGQIRDDTCVPVLIDVLKSDVIYSVKYECVQALGLIGGNDALEILIEVLTDNTGQQSTAISDHSGSISVQTSEHVQLRQAAAYALRDLGDKKAIVPLYNVLVTESDQAFLSVVYNALLSLVNNDDVDRLIERMQQSRIQGLSAYPETLLLDIIRSIGTPEALAAVEKWKHEQQGKST